MTVPRIGILALSALTALTLTTSLAEPVSSSAAAASEAAPVRAAAPAVLRMTNAERARHGCAPLRLDARLSRAASGHARSMSARHFLSHSSPDGRNWAQRIRATGYRDPGGENIAEGFGSVEAVMSAWMHSPEHRANILRCGFRRIGVGHAAAGGYWVQDFGY